MINQPWYYCRAYHGFQSVDSRNQFDYPPQSTPELAMAEELRFVKAQAQYAGDQLKNVARQFAQSGTPEEEESRGRLLFEQAERLSGWRDRVKQVVRESYNIQAIPVDARVRR
jgi:hypothetical protein